MNKFTEFQLEVLEKDEIDCIDVVSLLGDYQDEDLPPTLKGRLHGHMATCSYCREMKESYQATVELAGELRPKEMPVGARNRLRSALNEKLGLNLSAVG